MAAGHGKAGNRVSTLLMIGSAVAIAATYGVGFMRTRAAAERLTHASSRRQAVDRADVQQALDISRFTNAPQPSIAAPPRQARPAAGDATPAPKTVPGLEPVQPPGPAPAVGTTDAATGPRSSTAAPGGATKERAKQEASTAADAERAAAEPVVTPAGPAETPQAAPAPAPAQAEQPPAETAPAAAKFRDGSFTGWGYCRHGEIQATVTIQGGRIVDAEITQCLTRYSCDWIARLPPQVVSRQSAEVDFVSGATESADAFYYAIEDALKKAK